MGEIIFVLILLGGMLIFAIFCIKMAILTSRAKKKKKQQRDERINELYAKEFGVFNHVVGLPLPEKVPCSVYWCENKIVIDGGGSTFNLNLDKVKDVLTTTSTDIEKAYVSSAGGAMAGGMLFGPLGAIVCGRTKEKKSKTVYTYLVITYIKDDKLEYISFDATNNLKAYQLISLFKQCPKITEEIEL